MTNNPNVRLMTDADIEPLPNLPGNQQPLAPKIDFIHPEDSPMKRFNVASAQRTSTRLGELGALHLLEKYMDEETRRQMFHTIVYRNQPE